ncbi:hypothetical protein NOVOSPHI9U_380008 [Novosphingobium sp. 9U]|nr:hypothetical protein NOVOSPHI9U_380008 [Novosphingobium sp. 9U]
MIDEVAPSKTRSFLAGSTITDLSTRQYARLVDDWVTAVGLVRIEYGTHSLRRTKASII